MSNTTVPDSPGPAETAEGIESFSDLLSQYEKKHSRNSDDGRKQLEGTVIKISPDSVFLDIGFKSEGILPLAVFQDAGQTVTPGDKLLVSVKGRDPEGFYQLSRSRVETPKDWTALERAFAAKSTIIGTVTGASKGGLTVDVGVRAFMPASRSGARDAAEMEKLVGQEIRCRIIKLEVTDEDVVVDRRVVAEEEERSIKDRRYSEVREGDAVNGTVRSLTDYGAFVDLGGVDALLHVGDISWSRINKPADVLSVGQEIKARVLKIDVEKRRISVGMKQLQSHPWDAIAGKYQPGERIRGTVTRVVEFGAFVELEPGIEGLIHISEMSWAKKLKRASEVVKPGETVEAVILGVNTAERRMSLGLKQSLGDPWVEAEQKFSVGSAIEGTVSNLTKFGAFVHLSEGIEGMIHISDMSAEKRINHPQEVLRPGQMVKAQVLAVDKEKRQIRLGMKQLVPTGLDEYLAEHKQGDIVTGRLVDVVRADHAKETDEGGRVELGEGITVKYRVPAAAIETEGTEARKSDSKADLSSLTSMLNARWKGSSAGSLEQKPQALAAGQIRSFRIAKLDPASKQIEVELA